MQQRQQPEQGQQQESQQRQVLARRQLQLQVRQQRARLQVSWRVKLDAQVNNKRCLGLSNRLHRRLGSHNSNNISGLCDQSNG